MASESETAVQRSINARLHDPLREDLIPEHRPRNVILPPRAAALAGFLRLGLRDCRGSQLTRCWCGEIGKRRDPANLWAKALVGSTPTTSTPASPLTRRTARPILYLLAGSLRSRFRYAKRKPGSVTLSGLRILGTARPIVPRLPKSLP